MIFSSLGAPLRRCVMLAGVVCLLAVLSNAQPARPPVLGDDALRQAIQKRLQASKIRSNGFQVEVRNGIATLRGQTSVPQHKGVATRLAKLAGAREVDNQITITEAGKERLRDTLQRNARPRETRSSATNPKPANGAATPRPATVKEGAPAREGTPAESKPTGDSGEPADAAEPSSTTLPRFTVQPNAKRSEARSERRRY
ncbi:MAG: BON domain-containing protein [Bryobacterales bacterium]|nr:BON domain-containing protein [Bryobacterales bacterium]